MDQKLSSQNLIFNIENLAELSAESFHDFAISTINCDYENHIVYMPLSGASRQNELFIVKFFDVKNLSVGLEEPWGDGIYISDIRYVTPVDIANRYFDVILQLNSGDMITVVCTKFGIQPLDQS